MRLLGLKLAGLGFLVLLGFGLIWNYSGITNGLLNLK